METNLKYTSPPPLPRDTLVINNATSTNNSIINTGKLPSSEEIVRGGAVANQDFFEFPQHPGHSSLIDRSVTFRIDCGGTIGSSLLTLLALSSSTSDPFSEGIERYIIKIKEQIESLLGKGEIASEIIKTFLEGWKTEYKDGLFSKEAAWLLASKNIEQAELDSFLREKVMAGKMHLALYAVLKGANIHITDEKGNTLLHLAVCIDEDNLHARNILTQMLIFLGVDINKVNEEGDTALHVATRTVTRNMRGSSASGIYTKYTEVIYTLVKAGAKINIKNNGGRFPEGLTVGPGGNLFKLHGYLSRARFLESFSTAISLVNPKPSSEEVSSSLYSHLNVPLDSSSGDEQGLSEDELSDLEPSLSILFTLTLGSNALTYDSSDSDLGFGNTTPPGAWKTPSGSNSSDEAEQEDSNSE